LPEDKPVIVDTNIIFSSLLRDESHFSEVLLKHEHRFFVCEMVIIELFKLKEKIIEASRLSEEDIAQFYYALIRRIDIFKEQLIAREKWLNAFELCKDIDVTDTPHVALTLELDGLLWTGDVKLKEGLKKKGFDKFFIPD